VHKFTIGQRKGLKVSSAEPLYVQQIDSTTQRVVVGPVIETERQRFHLLRPHWVEGEAPVGRALTVKIRHRHGGAPARLEREQHGTFAVELDLPARAVTPGQAAVFYEGTTVLGGGWIA
jgi:tRNA-uridine 2-sulfurtransferase